MEKDIESKNTLIDAGCGFGDFYHFIKPLHDINYIGYEIVEENIAIAREHTRQKIEQKDILKDPLDTAKFYILSRFETYLFIERCFAHSQKGFVFNLLYGKDESSSFNYFLPQEIKHFAKKFDCEVITRTGYLPHDFTVYLRKIPTS